MALQWTPLRGRAGGVVRARQNVQTLEHPTQANVLLAFKLSMVAGNEVNSENRLRPSYTYRPYRKMAEIGIQCDADDSGMFNESPAFSSTVAEINMSSEISTEAEINTRVGNCEVDSPSSVTGHPTLSRPHSTESASSARENRRTNSDEGREVDVDAICEDGIELSDLGSGQADGQTECDGNSNGHPRSDAEQLPNHLSHQAQAGDKPDDSCGLDCLYFTMKCCECTIL